MEKCQYRHLWFFVEWDHEHDLLRICTECSHAYVMSKKEIQKAFPTYLPPPSKQRRRAVQLVLGVPLLILAILCGLSELLRVVTSGS